MWPLNFQNKKRIKIKNIAKSTITNAYTYVIYIREEVRKNRLSTIVVGSGETKTRENGVEVENGVSGWLGMEVVGKISDISRNFLKTSIAYSDV